MRYHLEHLAPETIKLLWSSNSKITKTKSGENIPCLKMTEVVLVQCNIVNNNYQSFYTFVPNKFLVNY